MRENFGNMFIYINGEGWKEDGVLLVARNGDVGSKMGVKVGEAVEVELGGDDGWIGGRVYKVDIEKAVEVIMRLGVGIGGEESRSREWIYGGEVV